MIERNGQVRTFAVTDIKQPTLIPLVWKNVKKGSSIMSDEYNVYKILQGSYKHEKVQHQFNQYVNGDIHTNTIEGFWGTYLKRAILGTYHWTSAKHMNKYLSEFDFRYNTRELNEDDRFNLALLQAGTSVLKYKQLIH